MDPLVTKRLINTEDYYKIAETGMFRPDEKIELINGEICTMAPIGSEHAEAVRRLSALFYNADFANVIISSQNPVYIDQWNELQPDFALLKHKAAGYPNAHPGPMDILIIAEVSFTTYDIDLNVKLPIYTSAGIPVYWIISLSKNRIEVYEEPLEHQYRKRTLFFPGDEISFLNGSFNVAEILLIK